MVAAHVEMLAGKRKKDYAAESAAQALETQSNELGIEPATFGEGPDDDDEALGEDAEASESDKELVAA